MVRSTVLLFALSLIVVGCNRAPNADSAASLNTNATTATTGGDALKAVPAETAAEPQLPSITVDNGTAAFAQLLAAARDNRPDAWTQAEQTLQQLGSAAVPTYVTALRSEDAMAREMAVMMLVQLGPPTKDAAAGLTTALTDASSFVRVNAAAALSTLETPPAEAIETLGSLMNDEDETIRVAAATSLGNAGKAAESVLSDLARGLSDPTAPVRTATAASLGRLGEASNRYLPALKRLEDDEEESVRTAVALAIKQLDPSTRSATGTTIPASATNAVP